MKKKGFTLIELMIVLAVIGILAVVIVPKSNVFKGQAKNTGVLTNVNTVRGYLEQKTGSNLLTAGSLVTDMGNVFTGSDAIVNPFDNSQKTITNGSAATPDTSGSVVVYSQTGNVPSSPSITQTDSSYVGKVIVYVYADGYAVGGIDKGGSAINVCVVK